MRHPLIAALFVSVAAHASDLDPYGRLKFRADALATFDFEDAAALAPKLRKVVPSMPNATWAYDPVTASAIAPLLAPAIDGIEGRSALHLSSADGLGYAIMDAAAFGAMANRRISVDFWGRAEGMEPVLMVTWGNAVDIPNDKPYVWARVPAVRTGRETTDGWVEYSTGPIDGSVLDRPIHDITLSGRIPSPDSYSTLRVEAVTLHPSDALSIDAVEIVPETGSIASGACTLPTADTACSASAECFYGRCIDSAVVWHPVPPVALQNDIVSRFIMTMTSVMADRRALLNGDAAWVAATSALVSADATPKTFWGGLQKQILALRDAHTHLGSTWAGAPTAFPQRPNANSSQLDVCFGPTLDDQTDGGLAYVVWQKGGLASPSLHVGDVVAAIDGMDPKAWVDLAMQRYELYLPDTTPSDWALGAVDLASMVSTHASTLSLSRCSGGTCAALPDLDIATSSLAKIANGQYTTGSLACRARFSDPVAGAHKDSSGNDNVLSASLDGGVLAIDFDGFVSGDSSGWASQVDTAFARPHDRIIIDAREGHGGWDALGQYMFQQLRSTNDPTVLAVVGRGSYQNVDAPWLFAFDWAQCANYGATWPCATSDMFIFVTSKANPPGGASRVAWLNTNDVSNNDMVPRLLKGRANLQMFAPWQTYGAVGSDAQLPPLMPNWTYSMIAAEDGRYGTDLTAARMATSFESGTGVAPDVVVTQTLSDVLAGRDTILSAAMQWVTQ